ncbi:MAG: putative Nudix hydrolase YfcD [candidate division WS2 bacterium ADurb.Bin280]|uniref:Putative Nudix hydrolase YfcD n=1 Tax=candidate division WS2 bacterium ADurb.Bin280 TaxID=1852829 RepID=A0A1V5SEE3_9BACT|nr:MAG: putative Nudix hydrolase YfcD [candidate division WS2 bacterium ADurb.Bin280]
MAVNEKNRFKDELIDVINDEGEVVGNCSQEQIYRQKKSHRIVHAMIFNQAGQLLLQKRSKNKNYLPGFFVTSAGGHVASGESPEDAIAREINEEIGVRLRVEFVRNFWYEPFAGFRKNIYLYKGRCEGPFEVNPDEVEEVAFFSLEEVRKMVGKKEKVHNELAFIINNYYQK